MYLGSIPNTIRFSRKLNGQVYIKENGKIKEIFWAQGRSECVLPPSSLPRRSLLLVRLEEVKPRDASQSRVEIVPIRKFGEYEIWVVDAENKAYAGCVGKFEENPETEKPQAPDSSRRVSWITFRHLPSARTGEEILRYGAACALEEAKDLIAEGVQRIAILGNIRILMHSAAYTLQGTDNRQAISQKHRGAGHIELTVQDPQKKERSPIQRKVHICDPDFLHSLEGARIEACIFSGYTKEGKLLDPSLIGASLQVCEVARFIVYERPREIEYLKNSLAP